MNLFQVEYGFEDGIKQPPIILWCESEEKALAIFRAGENRTHKFYTSWRPNENPSWVKASPFQSKERVQFRNEFTEKYGDWFRDAQ